MPLTIATLDEIDALAAQLTRKLVTACRAAEANSVPVLNDWPERIARLCRTSSAITRLVAALVDAERQPPEPKEE